MLMKRSVKMKKKEIKKLKLNNPLKKQLKCGPVLLVLCIMNGQQQFVIFVKVLPLLIKLMF